MHIWIQLFQNNGSYLWMCVLLIYHTLKYAMLWWKWDFPVYCLYSSAILTSFNSPVQFVTLWHQRSRGIPSIYVIVSCIPYMLTLLPHWSGIVGGENTGKLLSSPKIPQHIEIEIFSNRSMYIPCHFTHHVYTCSSYNQEAMKILNVKDTGDIEAVRKVQGILLLRLDDTSVVFIIFYTELWSLVWSKQQIKWWFILPAIKGKDVCLHDNQLSCLYSRW